MLRMPSLVAIGVILVTLSCRHHPNGRPHRNEPDGVVNHLAPLKLGMTRAEVERAVTVSEALQVLASPASFAEAVRAKLVSGVEAVVMFDDGDLVFCIQVEDGSIRFSGSIGVGSTWSEVRKIYPNATAFDFLGYGFLLRVARDTWIVFPFDSPKSGDGLQDEARVVWIEFRNDL